jgi:hypothetical protein
MKVCAVMAIYMGIRHIWVRGVNKMAYFLVPKRYMTYLRHKIAAQPNGNSPYRIMTVRNFCIFAAEIVSEIYQKHEKKINSVKISVFPELFSQAKIRISRTMRSTN